MPGEATIDPKMQDKTCRNDQIHILCMAGMRGKGGKNREGGDGALECQPTVPMTEERGKELPTTGPGPYSMAVLCRLG